MKNGASNPLKKYWQNGQLKRLPYLNGALRRAVDVRHNPHDFLVCLLGSCGFSSSCIMGRTHFTANQVQYRLKKGNISRAEYRAGRSVYASKILNAAPHMVLPLLQRNLQSLPVGGGLTEKDR